MINYKLSMINESLAKYLNQIIEVIDSLQQAFTFLVPLAFLGESGLKGIVNDK